MIWYATQMSQICVQYVPVLPPVTVYHAMTPSCEYLHSFCLGWLIFTLLALLLISLLMQTLKGCIPITG